MYGRYNRLGEFAKLESLKAAERKRVKAGKSRKKEFQGYQGRIDFSLALNFINTLIILHNFFDCYFDELIYLLGYSEDRFDKKKCN